MKLHGEILSARKFGTPSPDMVQGSTVLQHCQGLITYIRIYSIHSGQFCLSPGHPTAALT